MAVAAIFNKKQEKVVLVFRCFSGPTFEPQDRGVPF
jgi:hypothetical protein